MSMAPEAGGRKPGEPQPPGQQQSVVQPPLSQQPGRTFARGFRDALPIVLGYFSASIAFGLLARNAGLTILESQAFSFVAFTGAAQFMAITLITGGASGGQIILSFFLINLRYMLMSASVANKVEARNPLHRALLAFGVTDENFGVTLSCPGRVSPSYQAAVELAPWTAWNLGTLSGWLFGSILPSSLSAAMVSSLYALFMALLLPDLKKGWPWILTAGSAAAFNTVLKMFSGLGSGWSFVIAMIAGTVIGMMVIPSEPEGAESAEAAL